jgi:quercetin dioxygenase-like cupin family protein
LDPLIRVEHRVAEGDPVEEIPRLAGALHTSLIVMGTHGRTGLGRLLTGSVAEGVLRKAGCPVLVVRSPLPGTPEAETETPAKPGDIVDVRPLGAALGLAHTRRLLRSPAVEVVRLIVRAGEDIAQHLRQGEVILHCLEGRVGVTALGKTQTLTAGDLLPLPAGEPHACQGIEDASLLLFIAGSKH